MPTITVDDSVRYMLVVAAVGIWALSKMVMPVFRAVRNTIPNIMNASGSAWTFIKTKFSLTPVLLAGLVVLMLLPSPKPPVDPAPEPCPEATKDFLDVSHDNYRQLLADLYEDYSDKDLTDPAIFDEFDARRIATYKACYSDWNAIAQKAADSGHMKLLAEQLRDRKVSQ